MKKVCVDQNKCIGCGACVAINPENFDFNDEGLSEVKNENPIDKTIEAVEACPVFAISIESDTCGCKEGKECTCGDNCTCGDECTCHESHNCECDDCSCDGCDCDDCSCEECDCDDCDSEDDENEMEEAA